MSCNERTERALMLVLAAALGACGADPAGPPGTTQHLLASPLPRYESIDREARPVLRGFPHVRTARRLGAPSADDPEMLAASFSLPPEFAGFARVLVAAGGSMEGMRRWRFEPPVPVAIVDQGGRREVEVRFPRARLGGEGVFLRALVRGLPEASFRRIETRRIEVPAGARLELGFGVLDDASEHGPVSFGVLACAGGDCRPLLEESVDPRRESQSGWNDRMIPLADLAGEEVSFRFETRHVGEGPFSLPVWSDPVVVVPATPAGSPLNLLLVSLDTLRADRLPAYGYGRDTAPFITELAGRSVVFERAFAAASTTAPSHMTAFTGQMPSRHGLRYHIRPDSVRPDVRTLAEHLRSAGFATGAVTENGALAVGSGIERGFSSYREFQTTPPIVHRAETTFEAAREWIDRRTGRPFLLFVHTYQTHTPYRAPRGTPEIGGSPPKLPLPHAGLRLRDDWQPDAYDREIRYVDGALEQFLEGLEESGILENTLLVVLSDHGEAFLEHGYLHHGGAVHDEVLRVPLMFSGPGVAQGHRVSAPVGLVDLLPTLLELLDLEPAGDVAGRSFADLVRGREAAPDWWQRPIFSEIWADRRLEVVDGELRRLRRPTPTLVVRRGAHKLVREPWNEGARHAYYDLEADPAEQRDLYAEQPRAADDLRSLLDGYARESERHLAADRDPTDESFDPEHEAALRALGYLE